MGRYSRLGRNTILVFIGNIGAKFLQFLMLPLYTRWLSIEEFGMVDNINIYAMFLLCVATCCITDAIFVFPKGGSLEKCTIYFTAGIIFSFGSLLFTAICIFFLKRFFPSGIYSYIDHIWLIYLLQVSFFYQQYFQQFARSIDAMKVYTVSGILVVLLSVFFSIILVPTWKVQGYVFSLFLANMGTAGYSFFVSKMYAYLSVPKFCWIACKSMLAYSIPLIPNSIMWWLVTSLNRPLMEKYLGMHSIGLFALANKFPSALTLLVSVFMLSWQISVFEEFGKKGYKEFYNQAFSVITLFLMFCCCLMTIFSREIINIFATKEYSEAWIYMSILTLGVAFSCMSSLSGINFSVVKQSKYYFYSSLWAGIAAVILNVILIPNYGIMGATLSVCISFFIGAIIRIYYSWQFVQLEKIYKYIFAICVNVFVILLVYSWPITFYVKILSIIFSLASYILLCMGNLRQIIFLIKNNNGKKIFKSLH